jgi:catalase
METRSATASGSITTTSRSTRQKCPFHSYHRDGAMRTDGNLGKTPTYFPNSRGEWIDQPQLNEPPL